MAKAESTTEQPKSQFPGQHEGEEVVFVFHQHPLVMRAALIYGMLAILAGLMPLLVWPLSSLATRIAVFTPFFVLAYWFHRWVGWYYSVYIVTDQRIVEIKQRGFFNRRVNEYRFDKIQNVNYHIRGFQAVLFGYGDIVAQTYVGDIAMRCIHKPVEVHSRILTTLHKANSSTPPPM